MIRRSFLSYAVAMLAIPVEAQQAIMEGKKAVVCEGDPVECPNGHKTCKAINMPLAIGNDRYDYPEVSQIREYHVLRCDVCKVLFTRE